METSVAVVAYYQLHIVIVIILVADLAGHVLETFVPLLGADVGGPQTKVPFALLGAAEAFGEGSTVDIKLVVECEFLFLLDIPESENADAYFPKDVPLLSDAVGFAGVVDEPGEIALVGGVDNLSLRGLHQICAG